MWLYASGLSLILPDVRFGMVSLNKVTYVENFITIIDSLHYLRASELTSTTCKQNFLHRLMNTRANIVTIIKRVMKRMILLHYKAGQAG